MFITFRKRFCKFLIPISFFINPHFLVPEKASAELIQYNCELQTYIFDSNDKNWKYLKNRYWKLDVDQFNKSLIQKYTLSFKDQKIPIEVPFRIISLNNDSLVAVEEDMSTVEGGPMVSTITFKNLRNSKDAVHMTYTNHMQNNYRYDFTVHYGQCYRSNNWFLFLSLKETSHDVCFFYS